ncbi:hypothetical protein ACB092_06G166600 [Castanea dentata]
MLEDASAETSVGQQCKSGLAPLAHKFNYNQCEVEASDTEHQWACKDVLETIEAVPYHELSVIEYFTKFKRLGDQLLNLEPLPECSYGAMKTLSATHDKAYVMQFFMGLNENFETIRTQIMMYEPFPSISKVYALVFQEESHRNIGHGGSFATKLDSVVMYVNSKGNSSGNANWTKGNNKKERPLCTHCIMLGHTIDKCYKLHEYPSRYKPKGKSNANQVSYDQGSMIEHSSLGSVQCPITKAQYEQLLAFFNTSSNSSDKHQAATTMVGMASDMFSSTDWDIDTGATNQMVHSVSCFTSITSTLNTHVNLPNGEIALVTHIGAVRISETLILYDVLCVPAFSFNLRSVSKLAKSVLCCLIFLGTFCFIQDLAHWSTIGLGREYNGLYLLEESKSISTSASAVFSVNSIQPHSKRHYFVMVIPCGCNKGNLLLIFQCQRYLMVPLKDI